MSSFSLCSSTCNRIDGGLIATYYRVTDVYIFTVPHQIIVMINRSPVLPQSLSKSEMLS